MSAKFSATVFKELDITTQRMKQLLPRLSLVSQFSATDATEQQYKNQMDIHLCEVINLNATLEKTIDVLVQSKSGGETFEQAVARLGGLLQTFTELLQVKRPQAVEGEVPLENSTTEFWLWEASSSLRGIAVNLGLIANTTETTSRSMPEAKVAFTIHKNQYINGIVDYDVHAHCTDTGRLFGSISNILTFEQKDKIGNMFFEQKDKVDEYCLRSWLRHLDNGNRAEYILNHTQYQRAFELVMDGLKELMAAGDGGEEGAAVEQNDV